MRGVKGWREVWRGLGRRHGLRQASQCRFATTTPPTSTPVSKGPEVIFSGIQPSGVPHLGNYLGLISPFLELQRSTPPSIPLYLSIVGMHSITLPRDPETLRRDRRDMLAALIACGVDINRTCLFYQEDVSEHAELAWILNTLSPVGRLQRMTTWKAQLATRTSVSVDEVNEVDLKLGLLAYPVLQAADIMLYKATKVPVGEDQVQHLELARDIAETFNRTFGSTFPLPQAQIVPSKRILNLRDPSSKMSKSAPIAASRIVISDSDKTIQQAIKSAVTDSHLPITYDPVNRPGVSNLLLIYSSLDPENRSPEEIAALAEREGWGSGKLKEMLSEVVIERVRPIREEYERIRKEKAWLADIAGRGRETATRVAKQTMSEVKAKVGLDPI